MNIWLLLAVTLLIIVVNAIVVRTTLRRFIQPEVWDGSFDVVLDNEDRIPLSFRRHRLDVDIPKGRKIKKIVLKGVEIGCVPIVCLSSAGDVSAQFVTSTFNFSDQRRADIEYQVVNPIKLPPLVGLAVYSNQRIAGGEQRSTPGLFWPKHDIGLWYDRPGAN